MSIVCHRAALAACVAVIAFVALTGCHGPAAQSADDPADEPAVAPSWRGKPVVVEGVTIDGKRFSTAQWKGKVVLVDFWATWCVPCREELPHTKQLYAAMHDKGFEIVGVSSDEAAEALERFLAANPDITWPQLFDRDNPGDSPLGDKFEIDGYPTVLLLDRRGVLRFAGTKVSERMVRKLLDEKE